jgi:hypothetical protein
MLYERLSYFILGFFLVVTLSGFTVKNKRATYHIRDVQAFFQKQEHPAWMISQITEDLSPYQKQGISLQSIAQAAKDYAHFFPHNNFELARCRIQHGQVFTLEPLPTSPTRGRFNTIYQALTHLINIVPIPDLDFFICVGDSLSPDVALFFKKYHIPIFAFAKLDTDTTSILIPDCEALLDGFYEKVLFDTSEGRRLFPWPTKKDKAFWRGATTGVDSSFSNHLDFNNYQEFPRVKLALLSSQYPHLIDAKLTILAQITDPRVFDLLAPYVGRSLPVTDHLNYKYQILVDGNTCAYSRAYWQLFSDCLMFKQTSPNIQWYYRSLVPYVHYVPIAYDLSDLKDKIEWARHHDLEAQQIIANANDFAQQNLKKQDVYLYLYLLLQKVAELQKSL